MPGCSSTLSSNTTPSPSFFWRIILPTLFSRVFFFFVCSFLSLFNLLQPCFCLCFGILAVRHVGCWIPNQVPCIGRRRLNHWTTREGPSSYTLYDRISIRTVMGLQNSTSLSNQAVIVDWSTLPERTRILFWDLGMWVYDTSLSISSRAGEPCVLIAVRS